MCKTQIRIIFSVLLITISNVFLAIAGNNGSHLQPEEGFFGYSIHNPYYASVSERLLYSSWERKCQAVFLPSFSPENAVYIQYDYENPQKRPTVVSLRLKEHLWYEMQMLIQTTAINPKSYSAGPEAQRKVLPLIELQVNRLEAPIGNEVAKTLERVWITILATTQYPNKSQHGLDGETSHFANFTKGIGYQTGKTWSPSKDTTNYKLVELAKALQNYPNIQENERTEAAKKLYNDAQTLLKSLNDNK